MKFEGLTLARMLYEFVGEVAFLGVPTRCAMQFFTTGGGSPLFTTGLLMSNVGMGSGSGAISSTDYNAAYATATFGPFDTAVVASAGVVATFAMYAQDGFSELITGSVSTIDGSGDIKFNTTVWGVGDIVSITALTFQMPTS